MSTETSPARSRPSCSATEPGRGSSADGGFERLRERDRRVEPQRAVGAAHHGHAESDVATQHRERSACHPEIGPSASSVMWVSRPMGAPQQAPSLAARLFADGCTALISHRRRSPRSHARSRRARRGSCRAALRLVALDVGEAQYARRAAVRGVGIDEYARGPTRQVQRHDAATAGRFEAKRVGHVVGHRARALRGHRRCPSSATTSARARARRRTG